MKIFLTGMPGCGKSTFGRKAAQELDLEFIDLDKEIIKEEKMEITDIFESMGEEHFRNTESRVLREICLQKDDFILATGGGAPCFFNNMDFMNAQGHTIYIDTPIDIILDRLSTSGINKRPLIKKMGEANLYEGLSRKLEYRLPFYSKANIIMKFNNTLEADIINYIRDL